MWASIQTNKYFLASGSTLRFWFEHHFEEELGVTGNVIGDSNALIFNECEVFIHDVALIACISHQQFV